MKIYNLHFDGSWSDSIREELPEYSGVYLVYRGNFDRGSFFCREILYIGQAENIRARHTTHEKRDQFLAELRPSEVIFYSCAPVAKADLDRVENALIYAMRPKLNEKLTETFPYDTTTIVSDGQCSLLSRQFTVEKSVILQSV